MTFKIITNKKIKSQLLALGSISLLSISCSSVTPTGIPKNYKVSAKQALPSWTKQKTLKRSNQQIKLSTRLVEIYRPLGSKDIPAKKYEKILGAAQYSKFLKGMKQLEQHRPDVITMPSVIAKDGEKATLEMASFNNKPNGIKGYFLAKYLGSNKISVNNFIRITEATGPSPRDIQVIAKRIRSGQTILVGGIVDEESVGKSKKLPFGIKFGKSGEKYSREIIMAVTATLVKR